LKKSAHGFTLVELLVVIAIIAILAAVVVLIVNPLELTKRGRDSARLSDLANLQQAINVTIQESTGTSLLCDGVASPATCTGTSAPVVAGTTRNVDGTGWVKVNLTGSAVSIPTLPIDPTNSTGGTGFHYTYCADQSLATPTWKVETALESAQQSPKMAADGGNSTTLYEVGNANLATFACSY